MRGEVVAVGVDGVAGEQEQRVQVRVVLHGERAERLREPGARAVDDDDRDDRRRERGVGLHGGARLPAAPRRVPVTRPSHGTGPARPAVPSCAWPVHGGLAR